MSTPLVPAPQQSGIAAAFADLGAKVRAARPDLGMTPVETAADEMVAALASTRSKAAVIGWFKPAKIVESVNRTLRERVLTALVAECDVQSRGHDRYWRLSLQPRRTALESIVQDQTSRARLLHDTSHLAGDRESVWLRRLLAGKPLDPKRVKRDEMPSLLQVGEWTEHILPNAPKTSDVRGRLAQQAIEDSLSVLLHRFHGREAELSKLRRFVGRSSRGGPAPVFGISGIGGVGKSTLVARFVDAQLKNPAHRRGIVLIDFDRARFWSGDPIALTFELTRQIAAWFPDLAEALTDLRNNVRRNLLSSGFADANQSATSSVESLIRSTKEINHLLGAILRRGRIGMKGMRPLVVILDTFELLQGTRGQASHESAVRGVEAVSVWADELVASAGLEQLKLIVAGRAPIGEDPTFGPRIGPDDEIRLTGLDEAAAAAILRDHGLRRTDATLVIEAVSDSDGLSNPLILRLAARLVRNKTIRASALKDESNDGRATLDQELVQGMLYRRILQHIGDTEKDAPLAAIAHPGLVLRRVTPELIEDVLFPALKVKVPTPAATARDLFTRLRREVWLVQDAGTDAVTHRLDLRRTMLRLIDADRKALARKIHRSAIKYYEGGRDPRFSTEMAAGEAFYHRLMLMTPADAARIKPEDVRRFESSLFPTIDDLPRHVIGVVKSILDRPLSDEEGGSLPEPHRKDFVLRQGQRHLLNDEPYRALKLLESEPDLHPLWELSALAATVSWEQAKKRGLLELPKIDKPRPELTYVFGRKLGEPFAEVDFESSRQLIDRLNIASWIAFAMGDSLRAAAMSSIVLAQAGLDPGTLRRLPTRLVDPYARAITYRTVASRDSQFSVPIKQGKQPLEWHRLSEEQLASPGIAVEATRHAVLGARETGHWDSMIVVSGESLPPLVRHLKLLRASKPPDALTKLLQQLERTLSGLRGAPAGHILGTIARACPRPLTVEPSAWSGGTLQWHLLCPNPEFRGPIKFALAETFSTKEQFRRLAAAAWDLEDLRATDLRPDAFAEASARPGRAGLEIANLVLYLDRLSLLGQFLEAVRTLAPRSGKLTQVANAFGRWERRFLPGPEARLPPRPK